MKSRSLLLGLMVLGFLSASVFLVTQRTTERCRYRPEMAGHEKGIAGAMEWLDHIRMNPLTGKVSDEDVLKARNAIANMPDLKLLGLTWNDIGPNNIGGRTRAILVDRSNPSVVFAGAVAGGLWKTTTGGTSWVQVTSFPDMIISCIAQNTSTGAIYVGTGESYANVDNPYGTPGFIGSGIYESTDGGNTWHIYQNATPSVLNVSTDKWALINRLAVDPTSGRVFAATNKGLWYWDGSAWVNATTMNSRSTCVVIGSDHSVLAVIANKVFLSTDNGNTGTFVDKSPVTGAGRTEVAFAPSNPNYVYALVSAAGALKGIYRSTDKCATWTLIGPGGAPAFDLFGGNVQAEYDNAIAVFPNNPDRIVVGGINVWEWFYGSNFQQISYGGDVHADVHTFAFDHTNPNIYYVGSDGGVSKTSNGGQWFAPINKNYNVTQFYAVANSKSGSVMGGTQDNANPYVSRAGNDSLAGVMLYGGDGGWAAFSAINPDVFFGTIYYGGAWRSPDRGASYQSASDGAFFSTEMIGSNTPGTTTTFAPFVTSLLHWESFYNFYSVDSVTYKATTYDTMGSRVVLHSKCNSYPFEYILPVDLDAGDSIRVQDIISSRYFIALSSGIWMTKEALDFSKTPVWYKVSNVGGIQCMAVSNDGNYLFAGTNNGKVYRISNLLAVRDSLTGYVSSSYSVIEQKQIKLFSGRDVTSVAIDPNDPSNVLVTLGNYGKKDYVYYCNNALDVSPSFHSKQGDTSTVELPYMPVYSGLIEGTQVDGKRVIVGTEFGIFSTDDITADSLSIVWSKESTGMSPVPVFMLRQQTQIFPGMTKYGAIYAGTHGRGIFECRNFYFSVPETDTRPILAKPALNIYPNPVMKYANVNYTLPVASRVTMNIFDIGGRLVKSVDLSQQTHGVHSTSIDCGMLNRGSYIMQLVAGKESSTAKFVVTK